MPIKWSAVKVSEAMDEVEQQVLLADQFIAEAKTKVEAAKKIPNLPQYMEQCFLRLISLTSSTGWNTSRCYQSCPQRYPRWSDRGGAGEHQAR